MVDVQKYRKVKQILQKVVEENRKIQEIVDKQEILTSILISEKEFLLKRLMKFDDDLLISSDTDREDEPVAVVKSLKTKATKKSSNPSSIVQTTPSIVKASASTAISETPLQTPSKQPGEEGSKKKRALSSAKKVKKVVDYDRDESGAVLLPQVFGMTELVALGQVSLKPGYHSKYKI